MADFKVFRVMVNCTFAPTTFLLLLIIVVTSSSSVLAAICPKNQYLNATEQLCMNCTECSDGKVVLLPCELHRDTYCGPISDLSDLLLNSGHPHRHHHHLQHNRHHERHRNDEQGDILWRYGEDLKNNKDDAGAASSSSSSSSSEIAEIASSEMPFSGAETLVWDWQAIALISAIFACILFFLVITLYSLHQARQWRRLKDNFEADVEELSARLSLMASSSSSSSTEKCEFFDGGKDGTGSMEDSNYLNTTTRCVYLEQLLSVRTEDEKNNSSCKTKGNVYIEENKPKMTK